MDTIYTISKSVFQQLRQENSRHPVFLYILFCLLCVPMAYQANSISLGLFAAATLLTFKKNNASATFPFVLPVLLYVLMAGSMLWTIDTNATALALSKELPIVIIPVCFMLFPTLSEEQKQKILLFYSYGMVAYSIFYLLRAAIRYAMSGDASVFFYHGLVGIDVNAIHVSIFISVAFFFLLARRGKTLFEKLSTILLLLMVFLLLSKNIIATVIILIFIYGLFYTDISKKARLAALAVFMLFIAGFALIPQVQERFLLEYETITTDDTVNDFIGDKDHEVYNMSIRQAWNTQTFRQNDFFPGTAFRVYQFRIFCEIMQEDNSYLTGSGLNASIVRIEQKAIEHNIYRGGEEHGYLKNFHNQFVQNFAELGIFGLLLMLVIVFANLKNGLATKDFVHISFAVLMISLFLTESFLWRQRGVTFFAMMYCLFNSGFSLPGRKKNKPI
jgi:O-antigen ligase